MAFSNNYQIKLIETGLESGTWGTSTNNNLERIEQSLGQSVAINVESPPTGSTVVTGPPYVLTWITSDTANVNVSGSEGRAKYVEFVSNGSLTQNVTVEVRGNTSGILPNRFYLVRNSINTGSTAATLTLNAGAGSNYTIESGACALVVINGTSVVGGLTAGTALNAISNLQVDNLQFSASASDIKLPDNEASALEIKSTSANSEFLRFDTDNNHLEIAPGSGINTVEIQAATVDASSQSTKIEVPNSSTTALQVSQSSEDYLTVDTSNTKIIIGESATNVNTDLASPDINITHSSGTDVNLVAGQASALGFFDGGSTEFVRLDTANGTNTGSNRIQLLTDQCDLRVESGNRVQLISGSTLDVDGTSDFSATSNFSALATFSSVDINGGNIDGATIGAASAGYGEFSVIIGTGGSSALHLTNAGAYASFGTTAGSTGHGIRENSGTLNVKNTNSDDWGQPYHTGMVSGEGAYFEVTFDLDDAANLASNSASHGFTAVPRIIRCVLICEATDNGYAIGDEIDLSSLGSPATQGDINAPSGGTYGANSDDVFYALAGTLRAFPKSGYASGESQPVAMTKGNWNLKIMAWK